MEKCVQRIKCPECEHIQLAIVEQSWPWWVFLHECEKCGYIIMESDWNEIELGE